jgi:predicted RNA-binding protein with PIN domain
MLAAPGYDEVVLVLEGAAKGGVRAGRDSHVRTVHAAGHGDDTIVAQTQAAVDRGVRVAVVTADRALQARVQHLGAVALSPGWLLDQL